MSETRLFGIWIEGTNTWLTRQDGMPVAFNTEKMANMWFYMNKKTFIEKGLTASVKEVDVDGTPVGFDPKRKIEVVETKLVNVN